MWNNNAITKKHHLTKQSYNCVIELARTRPAFNPFNPKNIKDNFPF